MIFFNSYRIGNIISDRRYLLTVICFFCFLSFMTQPAIAGLYPLSFTDDEGHQVVIKKRPENAVSLVPSVTEIIFKLGAADAVSGITYHSSRLPGADKKQIVGGFFSPALDKIDALQPDVIFVSDLNSQKVHQYFGNKYLIITINTTSIADSFNDILLLGKVFDRQIAATSIIKENQQALDLISRKVPGLKDRKRVIRLMGRNEIMTPGLDSFQNELIKAAGGIPHNINKNGNVISISLEEWLRFNPEIIYGCGDDRDAAELFFNQSGWKDVDAVKNHQIYYFSCDLTCRAATHTGYFVSWLAANIYPEVFSEKSRQVLDEKITHERPINIDLDYVKNARITYSNIYDFPNKTLIVDFEKPMAIVSTLEGQREGIKTIGNHYSSPPCWMIEHVQGFDKSRKRMLRVMGKSSEDSSFLYTGADMDNLSIRKQQYKDMTVYALVTAGVQSNAVRMSCDVGGYYEPGTINIIILPNMKLSKRAMTRAIISATEAKTAAMTDLDIRSTYTPLKNQATGTGTDNLIIAEGTGTQLELAGGHSKLGELIAKAVYAGVLDAVSKQNGLVKGRTVFQRLKERNITISGIVSESECECIKGDSVVAAELENILLIPRYEGFVESALILSDDYKSGAISNLETFEQLCSNITDEIAGKPVHPMEDLVGDNIQLPPVLKMAFNALLNGVKQASIE
ncbi:MAG: adenosylcobinamide amidohydrolase [Desulfobacterales bacterium]|nr:adenosylcobinamide amidohydrolase [Desulfobacterales bacterium]